MAPFPGKVHRGRQLHHLDRHEPAVCSGRPGGNRRDHPCGHPSQAARGAGRLLRRVFAAVLLACSLAGFAAALPALAAHGDKEVFDALRVTVWYCVCTVPVQLAAGLLLAVLLSRPMRGKQAFRVISLIPYIAPTVATAAIFELLFSLRPDSFANQLLQLVRRGPLQWLQEPRGIFALDLRGRRTSGAAGVISAYWAEWAQGPSLALTSIVFYSWWVFVGYYALIYINGLAAIPRQLYEAAEVDGAGRLRSFFSITLPLLSPTTYFLSLLGVIGTFKAFTHLYVLRNAAVALRPWTPSASSSSSPRFARGTWATHPPCRSSSS